MSTWFLKARKVGFLILKKVIYLKNFICLSLICNFWTIFAIICVLITLIFLKFFVFILRVYNKILELVQYLKFIALWCCYYHEVLI